MTSEVNEGHQQWCQLIMIMSLIRLLISGQYIVSIIHGLSDILTSLTQATASDLEQFGCHVFHQYTYNFRFTNIH